MSEKPDNPFIAPEIDYLSRDFASFRQAMLDHLTTFVPDWREQNPADLGQALLDVLAYAGDYLSYYQDAVATEAYLGTARRRESIRRHARLLDYFLHEGCNARILIHVTVDTAVTLPVQTPFLTALTRNTVISRGSPVHQRALQQGAHFFESMQPIDLYPAHNAIRFHVAEGQTPLLAAGATRAYLQNDPRLRLHVGDVLVFMEVRNRHTGDQATADSTRRHPVRLTHVWATVDGGHPVMEIGWDEADAPPFGLMLEHPDEGRDKPPISVALGNIVLADHGRTSARALPAVVPLERYTPQLTGYVLTYAQPLPTSLQPVAHQIQQDARRALPAVSLWQRGRLAKDAAYGDRIPIREGGALIFDRHRQEMILEENGSFYHTVPWQVRKELLNSGPFARDFVVEITDNREVRLRFGFDDLGWQPQPGDRFIAVFRTGGGAGGNVGQEAINHVILPTGDAAAQSVISVRNPLPAVSGRSRERQETARLLAPTTIRTQSRCVTPEDYVERIRQHPDVATAHAYIVPGPFWNTAVIVVRRRHKPFDEAFRQALMAIMQPYRIVGARLEIREPQTVNVYVTLIVRPKPGAASAAVREALRGAFAAAPGAFFDPARFDLGQALYCSQIVAHALAVPGVGDVDCRLRAETAPDVEHVDHVAVPSASVLRLLSPVSIELRHED